MSWPGEDPTPVKRGPADKEWHRAYRDIGTRINNWKLYEGSKEHFQCRDCGYYWVTEVDTHEHMGRCWNCWMREAHPEYLRAQFAYASRLGQAPKNEPQEATTRTAEKAQAKAVVQRFDFGPKR